MSRVLITGAMGFIGSKLIEKFVNCGFDVIGWDICDGIRHGVKVQSIDLGDADKILVALKERCPDVIIHCAGCADVGKSVQNPEIDYHGNVTLTHNLMFCMHKLHMERTRFVFLSSAGVYGNPISLPITEDMPLNPMSPYAVHKVMCEELCKYFANNYGMDIKVARIFSAYGAGLRKQIFWDMYNKVENTGRLDMFGTGNESRDYIHVNDVIESLYILATTESGEVIFNVANGEEVTIRQATELFADCAGVDESKIAFNGVVREGDPLNWRADISKIQRLGYKKSMEMRKGLKEYCQWISELKISGEVGK